MFGGVSPSFVGQIFEFVPTSQTENAETIAIGQIANEKLATDSNETANVEEIGPSQ